MKRIILSVLAMSALLCGCQKDHVSELAQGRGTIQATIEEISATRTVMDENNNIRWSEGDQIVGFMKSTLGVKYQVTAASVGKTSASFEEVSNGGLNAGTELEHIIAYYPYSSSVSAAKSGSNYTLDVILPTEQSYVAESFGNGAMPMVAVSETNNITFRNVCGGMKLQLRGTQKVKSISLQGKNNEKLSGAAVVTAYTDETKPAITMASGASTSVTLNCGSGIQLNESKATEFIISLPPVLFSKGFTVTVTDAESKTYTVETDKANTVLRSSLLVMPAVKLASTEEEPDNGDDENIPVGKVTLRNTSLILTTRFSYTLTAKVTPIDATDQSVAWSSDNSSVVTVDQSGVITTLSSGTANITAEAGGVTGTCKITVIAPTAVATADYVDEYGVNHGKGIVIGGTVWAPVNCGYKAATSDSKGFPYGKLYQWGRKHGQGYSTSYDETVPEILEGPISATNGQKDIYANTFFAVSESPCDWTSPKNDQLWNSGTEVSPVKTENDPCPEGWRVPTYAELDKLNNSYSSWITVGGQNGRYFAGDYTYLENAPQVFFPAAGYRFDTSGSAYARGGLGNYWSSRPWGTAANDLDFSSGSDLDFSSGSRANGYSVRCVQE